ncbi:MAG: hypothetical protein ACJAS3_000260 [Roseivirga sp.]|jgi:hypothetical protein
MKKLLYIAFALSLSLTSIAQYGRSLQDREKIQAARIAFLTNRLDLSVEQAKVFWPIFTEYDSEKSALIKDYGQKKREIFERTEKRNLSDTDAKNMLDMYLEQKQAELDLEKVYLVKFRSVLESRQIWKVITFDSDFRRSLMKRISDDGEGEQRENKRGNN